MTEIALAKKAVLVKVDRLVPDPDNPRIHPATQVAKVVESIRRFGFNNPILLRKGNVIAAGHCRRQAAVELGLEEVPCIRLDHLSEEEARAYLLADNATHRGATMDAELEAAAILRAYENGIELDSLGYDENEVREIIDGTREGPEVPEPTEPPAEPEARPGDLWVCGSHRIYCGDSTIAEHVEKALAGNKAQMCFTDPPYNIDYEGKTKEKLKIENDKMSDEEFRSFCTGFVQNIKAFVDGCVYCCAGSGPEGRVIFTTLDGLLHCSTMIIWKKDVFTLGRGKYQNQYEPIWFGWTSSGARFVSRRNLSNVWEIARPKASREHPTMKPVELVSNAIKHASQPGDIVLDLFGGSGSTMMAAEQTGRKAVLVELDPAYVDVTVKRWEALTGEKAVRQEGDN